MVFVENAMDGKAYSPEFPKMNDRNKTNLSMSKADLEVEIFQKLELRNGTVYMESATNGKTCNQHISMQIPCD